MQKTTTKAQVERNRLERAREIANEVRAGNYLPAAFDSQASFFPARAIIKKDHCVIEKLFGDQDESANDKERLRSSGR